MNLRTTAALLLAATALSACTDEDLNRNLARLKDRKRRAARVLAPRMTPTIQTAEQSR